MNSHPGTEHFTDLFGGAIYGAESSDGQVVVVQTEVVAHVCSP